MWKGEIPALIFRSKLFLRGLGNTHDLVLLPTLGTLEINWINERKGLTKTIISLFVLFFKEKINEPHLCI